MTEQSNIKSKILKLMENKQVEEATELMNQWTAEQTQIDHENMKVETKIIDSLADTTVGELLERFPEGFVVSPDGKLFTILAAVSSIQYLAAHYPTPPPYGGYTVVSVPHYQEGDEKFGMEKDDTKGNIK